MEMHEEFKKKMSMRLIIQVMLLALIMGITLSSCSVKKRESLELYTSAALVTKDTKRCLECHTKKQPTIVTAWQKSEHATSGVGCYECHHAKSSDTDGFEHFGSTIAILVTPKDCARCHKVEAGIPGQLSR